MTSSPRSTGSGSSSKARAARRSAPSGAHFYAWETPVLFFSVDIYTCKPFDPVAVARFTRAFFAADDIVARSC